MVNKLAIRAEIEQNEKVVEVECEQGTDAKGEVMNGRTTK